MADCTRGQGSLWSRWPVHTPAPGSASSPTVASHTAGHWSSVSQVALLIFYRTSAIQEQRFQTRSPPCFCFQNPWPPDGTESRRLAKTVGSPRVCFVATDGAVTNYPLILCWGRCNRQSARVGAAAAAAATGTQLVVVGRDRSRLPGCCRPDGLCHLLVEENSKKESK